MARVTRLLVAATAVALTVLGAGAQAEQLYRCECCKAHFGNDPNAPTYWNRGLGYGRLIGDRKYEETLSRFNDAFRKGLPYTLDDIAWVSEALFSLGAIKSGIHDPNKRFTYYLAEEPQDRVAHDLWWMQGKYGGKIWDKEIADKYGAAALCTIGEVRKAYPRYWVAFNRHMSILLALGRFEEIRNIVAGLNKDSLDINEPLSDFLPKTMSEYVGAARYEEGAAYLATVKKAHGLKKATQDFWTERLLRAVDGAQLTAEQKKRLRAKIRAI